MSDSTFQRYEIKYLVDEGQRALLEKAFSGRMIPDPHGESTICSIYYDTPDFRLIRHSLEKPVYKEKLRLRSYGMAAPDGEVYLELKKKYKGVVYKRRIALPEQQANSYLMGCTPMPDHSQIGREIDYFLKYYGDIVPAVYLCYDRSAFFSSEDANLRATFDSNIRWRRENMSLICPPGGKALLEPGQSLFEIKTASSIPLWLVEVLDKGGIRKSSFSKYGEAYKELLSKNTERLVNCCA